MKHAETVPVIRLFGRELVRELGVVDSASNRGDLSLTQCHVLVELERHGTLTANELAESLLVDKSAISRTVTQLLDANLINLRDDSTDRRRKPLALTASGMKQVAEIHRSANERVQEALENLDSEELSIVRRGMSLYVKALHRARLQKAFKIRPSTKLDNPEITRLIRSVLSEFDGCAEGNANDSLELSDIHKAYGSAGAKFYVIERSDRIVGCGGFRPLDNGKASSTCEIRRMYFYNEARGLGLGRLLLTRCLEDAKRFGYRRCYLETKSNMTYAQKLYERFGFMRVNKSLSASKSKNGCDVFYSKELEPPPPRDVKKRKSTFESSTSL